MPIENAQNGTPLSMVEQKSHTLEILINYFTTNIYCPFDDNFGNLQHLDRKLEGT